MSLPPPAPSTPNMPAKPLTPVEHVLQFFDYQHLTGFLRATSATFHKIAYDLAGVLEHGPELEVALRKLVESKDAAVRTALLMVKAGTDPVAKAQASTSGWYAPAGWDTGWTASATSSAVAPSNIIFDSTPEATQ